MHILDLIMWIVLTVILWFVIEFMTNGEFTHELGAIAGFLIVCVFTIFYIVLFAVYPDYNWIDIFTNLKNYFYSIDIKL